jgi:hypothetical protein
MKKLLLKIGILIVIVSPEFSQAQVAFSETFQSPTMPVGWTAATTAHSTSTNNWQIYGPGNPGGFFYSAPPTGTYWADLWQSSGFVIGDSANLTSPAINLSGATGTVLSFKYISSNYFGFNDKLRMFYKVSAGGSLIPITFTCIEDGDGSGTGSGGTAWQTATLSLPAGLTATTYIVFQGICNGDDGVGVAFVTVNATTGINELSDNVVSLNTYPNPFNESSTISYVLNERTPVTIEVYDILGKRVDILTNEIQNSGEHKYTFSPKEKTNGFYFVKLKAGDKVYAEKLVEVR